MTAVMQEIDVRTRSNKLLSVRGTQICESRESGFGGGPFEELQAEVARLSEGLDDVTTDIEADELYINIWLTGWRTMLRGEAVVVVYGLSDQIRKGVDSSKVAVYEETMRELMEHFDITI